MYFLLNRLIFISYSRGDILNLKKVDQYHKQYFIKHEFIKYNNKQHVHLYMNETLDCIGLLSLFFTEKFYITKFVIFTEGFYYLRILILIESLVID